MKSTLVVLPVVAVGIALIGPAELRAAPVAWSYQSFVTGDQDGPNGTLIFTSSVQLGGAAVGILLLNAPLAQATGSGKVLATSPKLDLK
jgi:hypothetical protein